MSWINRENEPQNLKNNRFHQCRNLDGVFAIVNPLRKNPLLLIDDTVDSGWTMTVTGALLRQKGCTRVCPPALATSAGR
jgi:ATP-dependent DNA helicase RecQ